MEPAAGGPLIAQRYLEIGVCWSGRGGPRDFIAKAYGLGCRNGDDLVADRAGDLTSRRGGINDEVVSAVRANKRYVSHDKPPC